MADILDATLTDAQAGTPTPPAEPPPINPITGSPAEALAEAGSPPTPPIPTTPSDSLIVPPPTPQPPEGQSAPIGATQPTPPFPGQPPKFKGKKRPGAGAVIAGLLLLLLTLPVAVFYISQQQSTTDVRSRAFDDGAYPTDTLATQCRGALQSCDDQTPCCGGQNLYCMGTQGSKTCQQDDGTIGQCPEGGTCNKINAYRCSSLSGGECHNNKAVDVGSMDAGRAHAAGCGQVDVVCRGGSKDNLLCGGFEVINSGCGESNDGGNTPTPTNPPAGAQCTRITVYRNNEVFTDYGSLTSGNAINICVKGGNDEKGRIRVNGGLWTEVTTRNSSDEYCMDFTIPSGTTQFTIEAEVFGNGDWK